MSNSRALPPDRSIPLRRALRPGLHIKRWLLLLVIGVILAAIGIGLFFAGGDAPQDGWLGALTFAFLPLWARSTFFLLAGIVVGAWAGWRVVTRLAQAIAPTAPSDARALVNALLRTSDRADKRNGPKVVAIGGGTGMPQLLRGLRAYTDNITAIVTVADDGGSSGRLREQMGVLPPGDFRNNIAALSEAEDLMTRLFQYRFAERELPAEQDEQNVLNGNGAHGSTQGGTLSSGLGGHSFGNLFIATMAAVTGSFEAGISESSRVLAVRGRILPSTLENVVLCAEVQRMSETGETEWLVVEGESNLPEAGGRVQRLFLKPEAPRAYPEAIRALLQADLIVACPGSFYTSLLPNLLVPSIREAIKASAAKRVYICNVATQRGETDGYSVADHVKALQEIAGDAFDVVLANDNYDVTRPIASGVNWVTLPPEGEQISGVRLFTGDLVEDGTPWRHDSHKLAQRLIALYHQLAAEKGQ